MLSKVYLGQHATVKCDATSRESGIEKRTKQGDPISPILFNVVLEQVMRKMKAKRRDKYGIQLGFGRSSISTNLCFADDIVLVGQSLRQI